MIPVHGDYPHGLRYSFRRESILGWLASQPEGDDGTVSSNRDSSQAPLLRKLVISQLISALRYGAHGVGFDMIHSRNDSVEPYFDHLNSPHVDRYPPVGEAKAFRTTNIKSGHIIYVWLRYTTLTEPNNASPSPVEDSSQPIQPSLNNNPRRRQQHPAPSNKTMSSITNARQDRQILPIHQTYLLANHNSKTKAIA